MKTIINIMPALLLGAGLHAAETAQYSAHAARVVKIEATPVKTPEFQARGVEVKKMEPRQWLEIEAEVELITNKTGKLPDLLPELTAQWTAFVKDKEGKKDKGVEFAVKLMGASVYKNVRMEDGKLYLSAYIEPTVLEQYIGDGRVRTSDFRFAVTLQAEGLKQYGNESEDWSNWKGLYLDDGIVAKSKTPFALINIDRYPSEKQDQ